MTQEFQIQKAVDSNLRGIRIGREQLSTRAFNSLMRHTHPLNDRSNLIQLVLTEPDNFETLDAEKLAAVPPKLLSTAVVGLGDKGAENIQNVLRDLKEKLT